MTDELIKRPRGDDWHTIDVREAADLIEQQAARIAEFERILDGLPQDTIDGGWTARGISAYAKKLEGRISELEAARIAYASEFPRNAEGDPDVDNVHANIQAMKKDASRYQFIKSEAERGDTGWMFFWCLRTVDIPISQPRATLDEAIDAAIRALAAKKGKST